MSTNRPLEEEVRLRSKLPSFLTRAGNYLFALSRHAIAGFPLTTPETYKERLLQCQECEKLSVAECTECGCFVEEKAAWAEQECPLKKWLAEKPRSDSKCGGCSR